MNFEKILPSGSKRRAFLRNIYYKHFAKYSEEERIYKQWIKKNEPNKTELKKQLNTNFKDQPIISIVVPVYNTPKRFLKN